MLRQHGNVRRHGRVVMRPPLSTEQAAAVALIKAGHRTHATTKEAARTRLGFLRLTKDGQTSENSDRLFAELAHERFCRPRPTAVSGPLDDMSQAFVDKTLEDGMHAAIKAVVGAAFAKATPDALSHLDTTPRPRIRQTQGRSRSIGNKCYRN
jgi:hypothetical protein